MADTLRPGRHRTTLQDHTFPTLSPALSERQAAQLAPRTAPDATRPPPTPFTSTRLFPLSQQILTIANNRKGTSSMTAMIAAIDILYLAVALLTLLTLVLYRQFALLYLGSRHSRELTGPPVGHTAPSGFHLVNPLTPGSTMELHWATAATGLNLLILGGSACRTCAHLLSHVPAVISNVPYPVDQVPFIDQPSPASLPDLATQLSPEGWQYWRSVDGALHHAFDVTASPFVYLIDHLGVVKAKGLASSPKALEGFASVSRSLPAPLPLSITP